VLVFVFAVMPIQYRASSGSQKDTPTEPVSVRAFRLKVEAYKNVGSAFKLSNVYVADIFPGVLLGWVFGAL
jgi:F0F1-type ATP synthase assembly protein I